MSKPPRRSWNCGTRRYPERLSCLGRKTPPVPFWAIRRTARRPPHRGDEAEFPSWGPGKLRLRLAKSWAAVFLNRWTKRRQDKIIAFCFDTTAFRTLAWCKQAEGRRIAFLKEASDVEEPSQGDYEELLFSVFSYLSRGEGLPNLPPVLELSIQAQWMAKAIYCSASEELKSRSEQACDATCGTFRGKNCGTGPSFDSGLCGGEEADGQGIGQARLEEELKRLEGKKETMFFLPLSIVTSKTRSLLSETRRGRRLSWQRTRHCGEDDEPFKDARKRALASAWSRCRRAGHRPSPALPGVTKSAVTGEVVSSS
ncbi:hypothetical protein GWK47_051329 [Chionoecetes opilio]|uniref:Uncharacterized protein n=1 Tax=Chionoecetes opilio TaxID=41210 RepID=A0A8J5CSE9_CHIOP|nr:hypothetical protein GWK47_051329 [Chionoecetes opilio]